MYSGSFQYFVFFCAEGSNRLPQGTSVDLFSPAPVRTLHRISLWEIRKRRWRHESSPFYSPFPGWCALEIWSADFYFDCIDTSCRWFSRTWGCSYSAWWQHCQSSWQMDPSWWGRPSCDRYVWYECCFLCTIWHTNGCSCFFLGSGQCRGYVLYSSYALYDRIFDRIPFCGWYGRYARSFSRSKYSCTFPGNRAENGRGSPWMCSDQYCLLYYFKWDSQILRPVFF